MSLRVFVFAGLCCVLAGCRLEKPIEVKEDKKPADLMLAGIMIRDSTAWTVKVVGSREEVLEVEDGVYAFARSMDFSENPNEPAWSVPDGWQKADTQRPFRKATFEYPTGEEKALEIVVSELPLGKQAEDPREFIADNVNRWRKQMALDEVTNYSVREDGRQVLLRIADLVVPFMKKISVDGSTMYFERIEGTKIQSAGPPFAGGMGADMTMPGSPSNPIPGGQPKKSDTGQGNPRSESKPEPPFQFTKPESWSETPGNGVTVLRYQVGDDEANAIVSVSFLTVPWENTVTMWQGQLTTERSTTEQLASMTKKIEKDDWVAQTIEVSGEGENANQLLLGARIERGNGSWFIKLVGDRDVVESQKSNFESFVGSIDFGSGEEK